jgi:hypothetical protein
MTNNEYQMLGMTFHMLREFQGQRNQQAELLAREREPEPVYPSFSDELFTYPIFTNPGSEDQTAPELLADKLSEEQCQRWRLFFAPQVDKLPHAAYWEAMNQQLAELKHRYRTITSPRLAMLGAVTLIIMGLVAKGHFLLPALPILALGIYWYHSEGRLRKARHTLIRHVQEMEKLYTQRENLQNQLDSLPPAASMADMQACYTQAVTRLLQNTLAQLLPPRDIQQPAELLHNRKWQAFLAEGWGYQQLPLHTSANLTRLLLEGNPALLALHSDSRGKNTLFRVQYLHVWVLTERGILSGEAYYDRVTDTFLREQHELVPYTDLRRVYLTEQSLPEYAALRELLPDSLHKRYFRQPLGILTLETASGKTHTCALPPLNPVRQGTGWADSIGLQTDMGELARQLREHTLTH